jgi:hypothetical protein
MKVLCAACVAALTALVGVSIISSGPLAAQGRGATAPAPPGVETLTFHHVHLNSVNPKAAADYYVKPFAKSTTRTTFNGYEADKTGHIYLLFTKVAKTPPNELTGPQDTIWHFGWNTPDSVAYDKHFREMGLTIAQMWDGGPGDAGSKLVDMSSDVPNAPGGGFPTAEERIALRAQGAQGTGRGGFGYLRGPDGSMIENAQAGQEERFNHVHMYHESPACAALWYHEHLGASISARGLPQPGEDCKSKTYAPPTFPSFARLGFVRGPGSAQFGDISILIQPWPGGGLVSPIGHIVDHWALSTTDLDKTVARLKSEKVKFTEEIHPWGNTRAAMIEGPDRAAIELVEEKN